MELAGLKATAFLATCTFVVPAFGQPGLPQPPQGVRGPMMIAPSMPIDGLQGTREDNEMRACVRANLRPIALIDAAREVMRSVEMAKANGARTSDYRRDLLQRQFQHYQSLGGSAATPQDVRLPDDPCNEQKQALQKKSAEMEGEYRRCADARPGEMKASALSHELVAGREYLLALGKAHEEKRNNPANFEAGLKGSGEWRALWRADPAAVRAELAHKFHEYRSAGGTATRIEDVQRIPNPCMPVPAPAKPQVILQQRSIAVPRQ